MWISISILHKLSGMNKRIIDIQRSRFATYEHKVTEFADHFNSTGNFLFD